MKIYCPNNRFSALASAQLSMSQLKWRLHWWRLHGHKSPSQRMITRAGVEFTPHYLILSLIAVNKSQRWHDAQFVHWNFAAWTTKQPLNSSDPQSLLTWPGSELLPVSSSNRKLQLSHCKPTKLVGFYGVLRSAENKRDNHLCFQSSGLCVLEHPRSVGWQTVTRTRLSCETQMQENKRV